MLNTSAFHTLQYLVQFSIEHISLFFRFQCSVHFSVLQIQFSQYSLHFSNQYISVFPEFQYSSHFTILNIGHYSFVNFSILNVLQYSVCTFNYLYTFYSISVFIVVRSFHDFLNFTNPYTSVFCTIQYSARFSNPYTSLFYTLQYS